MSDTQQKKGKKGKKDATATSTNAAAASSSSAPSADALLDLVAAKIDSLEGASTNAADGDENSLTKEELAQVQERINALQISLKLKPASAASAADGDAAVESVEESAPTKDQLSMLLDLFQSELQQRLVATRQAASAKEKILRVSNQKKSLESLCKELQARNKKLGDDLRVISVEQSANHASMKEKFEVNLADIQVQLNKHTEERLNQAKENEKLRENLNQLLTFDAKREEFFNQQLKTKELELKLSEAKLAQQSEFAAQQTQKSKIGEEKIAALLTLETTLRTQISSYAEKFDSVQQTLTKSNELFATFKSEMEKTSTAMKKMEKQKNELEKQKTQAQLSLVQAHEERTADAQSMEKLKRQNQVLANLCKELKNKIDGNSNKENQDANNAENASSTPATTAAAAAAATASS